MVLEGDHEKRLPLDFMRAYGVENVRGGPWCRITDIAEPLELWAARSAVDKIDVAKEKSAAMSVMKLSDISLATFQIGPAQKSKNGTNEWHITLKGTRVHPRFQPVSNALPMRVHTPP